MSSTICGTSHLYKWDYTRVVRELIAWQNQQTCAVLVKRRSSIRHTTTTTLTIRIAITHKALPFLARQLDACGQVEKSTQYCLSNWPILGRGRGKSLRLAHARALFTCYHELSNMSPHSVASCAGGVVYVLELVLAVDDSSARVEADQEVHRCCTKP